MASVFQRGGRWYVKVKDATGIWRMRPTSAASKTEAKRLAGDLARKSERQRFGLEALPTDSSMTLAELCRWWLASKCPALSQAGEQLRLGRHILSKPIGALPLQQITTERIEDLLSGMKGDGAAPATLNKVRAVLHTVFVKARKAKLWTGPNPVTDVETCRVPKRAYQTLRAEEVPSLLPHVEHDWRNLFAAALWTGLRKGELCGLLKSDVDLPNRTLLVARSYDHDTTKGGHADVIPIAEPLVPYLEGAIRGSPSQWVFPAKDGSMRTEACDPQKVLRTALGRAGIVEGFEHVCRRCKAQGKPHSQRHPDRAPRLCEGCGMKLWPRAIPRAMRFHDLRHSAGTLMLRAGVDSHRVQRILRHASINTTLGTYGHLDVEDLRAAVNTIAPQAPEPEAATEPNAAVAGMNPAPFGATVVQTSTGEGDHPQARGETLNEAGSLPDGRSRFRTCDPCRVKPSGALSGVTSASQPVPTIRASGATGVHRSQPVPPVAKAFGATVVQPAGGAPRLRSVDGGADRLLTVREVAERLGVSTATVYKLVERGELAHVRVSNAIRFTRGDLERFLEAGRR